MAWVYVARDAFSYSPNGPTSTGPYYKAKKGQYFYLIDETATNSARFWTWDDVYNKWRIANLEKCDARGVSGKAASYGLASGYATPDRDITLLSHYAADRYGKKYAAAEGGSWYSARYNLPIYNQYGGFTRDYIPKGSRVYVPYGYGFTKGMSERDIRLMKIKYWEQPPNGAQRTLPSNYWVYDPARDWAPSMYNLNTF